MAEYASKGVAGTALGLGIAGTVGLVNQLDIELAKGFINSAFDKSGIVPLFGFNFDKTDGEALVGMLEKYKDS